MQSKLKSKGYDKGKVDGKFGPETRRAVRKFQEAIGITVDGKPGNRTLTALYEGTSAINGTRDRERIDTSKPKNPNTLYYGCEGTKVKSLQQMLKKVGCYKGAIDGVYGLSLIHIFPDGCLEFFLSQFLKNGFQKRSFFTSK